jgi:hypothetical protein
MLSGAIASQPKLKFDKRNERGNAVNTVSSTAQAPSTSLGTSIQQNVNLAIEDLLVSLPDPKKLSADQRRGIIARYTAVLEGNFIYWMTGAYLAVRSEEARAKILENLSEEVRDSHPRMLRTFTLCANAAPTEEDTISIHDDLTNVRLFIGRLSSCRIVTMMAFFEGFIQRFMPYLAELARMQGSSEFEYTDVHGVCDVTHTMELFNSLTAEMALQEPEPITDLFEGVNLLRTLMQTIIHAVPATCSAVA